MDTTMRVLGLVGSPNRAGRTHDLVQSALEGARQAGAATELIQMSDYRVAPCQDCLPWACLKTLACTYQDEAFVFLSQKLLNCNALILGTPVYWWDTSGLIKYFMLKMFRIYARSAPLHGLPALGIGIAGGTGNGLISGLRSVYHFFQMMQMRAISPLHATRFNFPTSLQNAWESGWILARMSRQRAPFAGLEERLLWYDALPYLSLTRSAERRLLADLTILAIAHGPASSLASGLVRADTMAAVGQSLESLTVITKVYEAGVKVFDAQ